jgi:RNA polymerase sigma factor (sigma-70 family)
MDQAAQRFETLYMSCYAPLMRFAVRRVGEEDAADVVAETFTIAWRRRHRLHDKDPLPWLYGITRKVIANHVRSRLRRNRLTQRVATVSPALIAADHADQVLQRLHLDSAVAALSERDREALRLAEWEQLSPAEAATAKEQSRDSDPSGATTTRDRDARRPESCPGRPSAMLAWKRRPGQMAFTPHRRGDPGERPMLGDDLPAVTRVGLRCSGPT